MSEVMDVQALLMSFEPGDDHTWQEEFADLRARDPNLLAELLTSIEQIGMVTPILLGTDGRVWDGHHRLCIAYDLGFSFVPVHYAIDDQEPA